MGFFPNGPTPAGPISGVTVTGTAAANEVIGASSATAATWQLGWLKQAATANAGFALTNGTPTILSFTTPNDGNNHRYTVQFILDVATLEVGGATGVTYTAPDGTVTTAQQILAGGQAAGTHLWGFNNFVVAPNTTFAVVQTSALTGGAATAFAEIWGS